MFDVQVRGGQLWGTDIYTDDSDLVAGMYVDFVKTVITLSSGSIRT